MTPHMFFYFWVGLILGIGLMGMLVGLIMIWSDRPKRNCDVLTPAEQAGRFKKFCHLVRTRGCDCSNNCQFINEPDIIHCQFAWSQMPYKKENSND